MATLEEHLNNIVTGLLDLDNANAPISPSDARGIAEAIGRSVGAAREELSTLRTALESAKENGVASAVSGKMCLQCELNKRALSDYRAAVDRADDAEERAEVANRELTQLRANSMRAAATAVRDRLVPELRSAHADSGVVIAVTNDVALWLEQQSASASPLSISRSFDLDSTD